ncbi:MAG TPA: anthranilate synthase component I family protein [Flavobacteriales bacterium]|nr:anthranilate synthase component I family protein [Flavobacteriales bacterium]
MKKYEIHNKAFLGDTLTPVSVYLALRDHFADCKLLESAEYGKAQHTRSIIACKNLKSVEVEAGVVKMTDQNGVSIGVLKNGLAAVLQTFYDSVLDDIENKEDLNAVGLIGYMGYNSIQYIESIELSNTKKGCGIPDIYFGFYEFNIVFDHFHNQITVYQFKHNKSTLSIENVISLMARANSAITPFVLKGKEQVLDTNERFLGMVDEGKKQCQSGNVFQVVFSRKFIQGYAGDEFNVYRNLRHINPSPYMFFFDHGNFKMAGSSPETHVEIKNNKVSIHPIAGTIKRKGVEADDNANLQKLINDPKENAEHDMLIDLARNDLSIYCREVEVKRKKEVQQFSHVYHLVSEVSGVMKNQAGIFDILTRTFPAGTLTGAPKYKAMQLIDETETHSRDFYGGAIGFVDLQSNLNLAILIRTLCAKDGIMNYFAGAGITVSSKPENELIEINNKINALRKAMEMANSGLN